MFDNTPKDNLPTFAEWLEKLYRPLFGAEGDEGDEGDGGDNGDDGDDDGDHEIPDDVPGGSGGEPDADGFVRLPKAEADALRREVAENRRKASKAEREAKAQRERQMAEQGRWEDLAAEREREAEEAAARADAAEYQLDNFQRQIRVTSIATRLGFKDPSDAIRFLDDDVTGDDDTAERALKRLADSKEYLVEKRRPSGGPLNGGSKGISLEDIKNMSQDEINANWEAVQSTLAQAG